MTTTNKRLKDSPPHKGILVNLDMSESATVPAERSRAPRSAVDAPWRRHQHGQRVSSYHEDITSKLNVQTSSSNQRTKSRRNITLQSKDRSTQGVPVGNKDILSADSKRTNRVRRLDITAFEPKPCGKNFSSKPPHGTNIIPLPSTLTATKFQGATKKAPLLNLSEGLTDASSSVVSMRSASSGSRASGECSSDVTSHVQMTSNPGRSSQAMGPRNTKHGLGLPSVRTKPQIRARRSSDPALSLCLQSPRSPSFQQPTEYPPVANQSWPGDSRRTAPVGCSQTPGRSLARLERTHSHPQFQSRTLTGNPTQKQRETSSSEPILKGAKGDDIDENTEEDDEEGIDNKVMSWLSGLDSATCQRFMRRQMASLQEIDDH